MEWYNIENGGELVQERFEILTYMVWGVRGNVQKLKTQIAEELGIKGAHVFTIYLLRKYPQGLTAGELCELNDLARNGTAARSRDHHHG